MSDWPSNALFCMIYLFSNYNMPSPITHAFAWTHASIISTKKVCKWGILSTEFQKSSQRTHCHAIKGLMSKITLIFFLLCKEHDLFKTYHSYCTRMYQLKQKWGPPWPSGIRRRSSSKNYFPLTAKVVGSSSARSENFM